MTWEQAVRAAAKLTALHEIKYVAITYHRKDRGWVWYAVRSGGAAHVAKMGSR